MKRFFGLTLLSLTYFSTMAQSKSNVETGIHNLKVNTILTNTVTGLILDDNNKPLASITVSLVDVPAKSSVYIARTDQNGNYTFRNVPKGNYILQSCWIGKMKKSSEPIQVNELGENSLATVIMKSPKPGTHILDSLKSLSKAQ